MSSLMLILLLSIRAQRNINRKLLDNPTISDLLVSGTAQSYKIGDNIACSIKITNPVTGGKIKVALFTGGETPNSFESDNVKSVQTLDITQAGDSYTFEFNVKDGTSDATYKLFAQ